MNDLLLDPLRHHTWANRQLFEAARPLPADQLAASLPGTYGSVLDTLHHLVFTEGFYAYVLTDGEPGFEWDIAAGADLDLIERRLDDLDAFWDRFLAAPVDPERIVARRGPDGSRDEATTGIALAQVLDHGSVHREQVSSILTSLGVAVPVIDAWAYGIAAGRVRMGVTP